MHNEELKISKDIEIKFHRLLPPTLNSLCLPLSGLYNPIDNEESSEYSLKYKYKNYELSPNNFVNISNLMTINNNFGKIFKSEQLEGLISFSNISSNEITIKNILISLIKMEDYRIQQPFESNISDDPIIIPSNTSYTINLRAPISFLGKYKLEIFFNKLSPAYDDYYYKVSQRNIVKENANNYNIIDGHVQFCDSKTFSFESFKPFKISEFFHNLEVNKSLIEIRITNIYSFPLTILDTFLTPNNNNNNEKIPLVINLEQMAKNNNKLNDSKYLVLQPGEQIRILFNVNNTDLFYDTKKFTLSITWLNNFDFNKKIYIYDFKNNINSYNEYYRLVIAEKPNNDIILNQNFRIIINLIVKKYSKKFNITMNKDPTENNKSINKEIEIIDITEKMIELDSKIPSYNFILICKSDILGKVYLPNFKFCLYEGDKNIPIEFVYENLLTFNCISK